MLNKEAYHMHGCLAVCLGRLLAQTVLNTEADCLELVVSGGVVDGHSSHVVSQEQVTVTLHQEADTSHGYTDGRGHRHRVSTHRGTLKNMWGCWVVSSPTFVLLR